MAAEWITRGAGPRDSRELLTALDNLGVSHAESAQTLHTSLAAATLGRNLEPALEIFADMVLRPHLDDDEVEPIRALCLQNLRSLEDDPGTKVIYELRRRHFPDPWGRPSPGTTEGVAALTPEDLRRVPGRRSYRPNGAILGVAGAIDWPRLRDAVGRLFGDWTATARPARRGTARRPAPRSHPPRDPADPDRAGLSRGDRRQPRLLPGPRRRGDPGRLFLGPAVHRGPREARPVLLGLRQLTRASAIEPPCSATPAPRPTGPSRRSTSCWPRSSAWAATGVALEELETMRAGLKSSLIMAQESSMSRSGALASDWYFLGRVRPIEEIAAELDALTPEAVSEYAAKMQRAGEPTILTLGPSRPAAAA